MIISIITIIIITIITLISTIIITYFVHLQQSPFMILQTNILHLLDDYYTTSTV